MTVKLPPLPENMKSLPVEERGYPVPWFVSWGEDGKPQFPVVDTAKLVKAVKFDLCWICGKPLGRYKAFVVGPMCCVNKVSSEPPSHGACAVFAVKACPFLVFPKKKRDTAELDAIAEQVGPGVLKMPGGIMLERNPGVSLIWTTHDYRIVRTPPSGVIFRMGQPIEATWWAHGRPATLAEVEESIDSGLPILGKMAEEQGQAAVNELQRLIGEAAPLLRGLE